MPQRTSNGRVGLKPTQERVLAVLSDRGSSQLTRGEYEEIAGVSRSQAAYDLAELVEAEVLERVGGGRATRYRLVRRDHSGQRRWTTERIRADLDRFCGGRKTWPSATEFKAAGRADLYVAASRYGGIAFWAAELGFARPGRAKPPPARISPWRPRLRWAAGGAALAGALFAAAGAGVYAWPDSPARDAGTPKVLRSSTAKTSQQKAPTRRAAAKTSRQVAAPVKPKQRTRKRAQQVEASTPAYRTQLAVQRVSALQPSRYVSSTPRQETREPSTTSSAPAPLAAPAGGGSGGPAPLPPPSQ